MQSKAGHNIPHATSPKSTEKEHDKNEHLDSYSEEKVIKHSYSLTWTFGRWRSTSNFTTCSVAAY